METIKDYILQLSEVAKKGINYVVVLSEGETEKDAKRKKATAMVTFEQEIVQTVYRMLSHIGSNAKDSGATIELNGLVQNIAPEMEVHFEKVPGYKPAQKGKNLEEQLFDCCFGEAVKYGAFCVERYKNELIEITTQSAAPVEPTAETAETDETKANA